MKTPIQTAEFLKEKLATDLTLPNLQTFSNSHKFIVTKETQININKGFMIFINPLETTSQEFAIGEYEQLNNTTIVIDIVCVRNAKYPYNLNDINEYDYETKESKYYLNGKQVVDFITKQILKIIRENHNLFVQNDYLHIRPSNVNFNFIDSNNHARIVLQEINNNL